MDIFNFSFLDILACVIGLLIFILTIVVISGAASSGPEAQRQASDLQASGQSLTRAAAHADAAADRKHAAEKLLARTSADLNDSTTARDVVVEQTSQFESTAAALDHLDAAAKLKIANLHSQMAGLDNRALNDSIAAQRTESSALERQTATLNKENDALAPQAGQEQKAVTYYIPRLRESSRTPVFIEMKKGRFWFVESDDYTREPRIAENGTTFARKPNAIGMATSQFAKSGRRAGTPFQLNVPADSVLTFLVRPDSFDDFRSIREWAWKNGYAVHWIPLLDDSAITLVPAHNSWQQ